MYSVQHIFFSFIAMSTTHLDFYVRNVGKKCVLYRENYVIFLFEL